MFDLRRRAFISLVGAVGVGSSLLGHAQDSPITTVPQIEMTRIMPVEDMPAFRLGEDLVDLMKGVSLSSAQGMGRAWKMPLYTNPADGFPDRYGRWCNHIVLGPNRLPWYNYISASSPCSPDRLKE
jgi:hypothetical protein